MKQYLDPVLRFALLLFIAVLIRQIVTKHLTYIVNQERYAKAVQDLLFKGHVLARLCDQWAYQPLYTRPPPVSAEKLQGVRGALPLHATAHPTQVPRVPLLVLLLLGRLVLRLQPRHAPAVRHLPPPARLQRVV